ncbi:hypothetical protein DB347_06200 [Opitutaceae bacterium EW11]|nr:hypothetical protein DB347_06200 [Opitutaceae bacterium EW11]
MAVHFPKFSFPSISFPSLANLSAKFSAFKGRVASALKSVGTRPSSPPPLSSKTANVGVAPGQAPIKALRQAVAQRDTDMKTKLAAEKKLADDKAKDLQAKSTHLSNQQKLNGEVTGFDKTKLNHAETKDHDSIRYAKADYLAQHAQGGNEKFQDDASKGAIANAKLKPTETNDRSAPKFDKLGQQLANIHDNVALRPSPLKAVKDPAKLLDEPSLKEIGGNSLPSFDKKTQKAFADDLSKKMAQLEKAKNDPVKSAQIQSEIDAMADQLGEKLGKAFSGKSPKFQANLAVGNGGGLKDELWQQLRGSNKGLPSWNYQGSASDYPGDGMKDFSVPKQFLDRAYNKALEQFDTRIDSGKPPTLTYKGEPYKQVKLLGKGGGGVAYLYENAKGEKLVMKTGRNTAPEDISGDDVQAMREEMNVHLSMMNQDGSSHPNIIGIKGIVRQENGEPAAILEYAPNGDVSKMLDSAKNGGTLAKAVDEKLISPKAEQLVKLTMLKDSVSGMVNVQENLGVHHGDFKPGNLFIGADGQVKVADFGLAKNQLSTTSSKPQGTLDYMAPEHLLKGNDGEFTVTGKADTYAVGVFAYKMFHSDVPFPTQWTGEKAEMLKEYAQKNPDGSSKTVSALAANPDKDALAQGVTSLDKLVNAMMHPDPEKRPALNTVLNSTLFEELGVGANDRTPEVRNLIKALSANPQDKALIKSLSEALGV